MPSPNALGVPAPIGAGPTGPAVGGPFQNPMYLLDGLLVDEQFEEARSGLLEECNRVNPGQGTRCEEYVAAFFPTIPHDPSNPDGPCSYHGGANGVMWTSGNCSALARDQAFAGRFDQDLPPYQVTTEDRRARCKRNPIDGNEDCNGFNLDQIVAELAAEEGDPVPNTELGGDSVTDDAGVAGGDGAVATDGGAAQDEVDGAADGTADGSVDGSDGGVGDDDGPAADGDEDVANDGTDSADGSPSAPASN